MTDRCMYSRCSQPRADDSTYGLCARHEKNAKVFLAQPTLRRRRIASGACADCGEVKDWVARCLCRACYMRHRYHGTLDQFPPLARRKVYK